MSLLDALAKALGSKQASSATQASSRDPMPVKGKTAAQILDSVKGIGEASRNALFKNEIIAGNYPEFLKKTVPVYSYAIVGRKPKTLVFHVFPDYLMFGTNEDYCTVNMAYAEAHEIAEKFDCILPNKKMVNLIYGASKKLTPHTIPWTPQSSGTECMLKSHGMIEAERVSKGFVNGELIAGHKKDVILSPRYMPSAGREVIYGWFQANGVPIQPESNAHDLNYSDYSHGARMVSKTCQLDGVDTSIETVLSDPQLCVLLSDEGPYNF